VKRFWSQPNKAYRDFQIAYTAITANFAIPAVSYYLDRDGTIERARRIARFLGEAELPASEDSRIWWVLGAGNVATLAFMCAFLQTDLPRNRAVLTPLVFLKLCSAFGYLGVYMRTRHRFFLAAALLDKVTAIAMWALATRALTAIDADPGGASQLVPRPFSIG
jgi:hypothetical protein